MVLTPYIAYLCGVFAGDGSIWYRAHKHEYSLKCVGNPSDEQPFYDAILAPLIRETFGILCMPKMHDTQSTYGFTIYSKALYYFLTTHIGLPSGRKHPSLRMPSKFLSSQVLLTAFIRGVCDTDGCITFKKRYTTTPYYPTIVISSQTPEFIQEIATVLQQMGFSVVTSMNRTVHDSRTQKTTTISRIELNGVKQLRLWMDKIGFWNPKHLRKIFLYRDKKLLGRPGFPAD